MKNKKSVRVVHIDDDESALSHLKELCASIPGVVYLAGFSSPSEGLAFTNSTEVDLLFLDIEMPEMSGLDLVRELWNPNISVVFLTNYAGYVTQAFDACALHYLLKPVDIETLTKGIKKYWSEVSLQNKNIEVKQQVNELVGNYLTQTSYPKRVFINQASKILIVDLEEVICMISSANYTYFYTISGDKQISSRNIKIYEEVLSGHPDFVRIHRSYIINKKYLSSVKKYKNRSAVVMKDGQELDISRAKRDEILKLILS